MHLKVPKKTGFKVLEVSTPVIIKDYRGIDFYDTTPILKNGNIVKSFNLPEGAYFVESGNFAKMKKPKKYKLAKLPPRQRLRKLPTDFEIIFGTNPSKCTIFWDNKVILFDNDLMSLTLPELFFILYHEYGHALYKTEKFADLYSANMMKIKGYNPLQIASAPIKSLDKNEDRKIFAIEQMLKTL